METGLRDKVALVSGGSGAIGRAIARALAAEGAAVAVGWHRARSTAEELAAAITDDGGRAEAVRLDQGDPEALDAALRQVTEALGDVSVLVANAVSWPDPDLAEMARIEASLITNTLGTAALVEATLPMMRSAGWGRVVLISTDIVAQPMPGSLAYAGAKGGLEAAARVLAVREARHGILTNVVRPGFTLTERVRSAPVARQSAAETEAARTPTGRLGTPDDVASAVTYLASAANTHVNGQVLSVSGGRELVR